MSNPNKLCSACGAEALITDLQSNSGSTTCENCGLVMHENPIVSDLQFGENSAGGATVQGSMVGVDQARATGGGRQNGLNSREQTLVTAKRNIKDISIALNIPDYVTEAAYGWFHLALSQNFVQGRRSQNVTAACLYVACRKEKTHHMLIDFSSKLQISVYSLGATFLKMVKALHIIKLPLADPSLYIQHFVEALNFDEVPNGNMIVAKDAVKLAQIMAQDWIHEGRRPSGIAGACVLLASRMNNFRRDHVEIVRVAHVASDTIQKRLNEFKNSHAGSLSIKGFRDASSIESSNPPSFERNRIRQLKVKRKMKEKASLITRYKKMLEEAKNGSQHQYIDNEEMSNKRNSRRLKTLNQQIESSEDRRSETTNFDEIPQVAAIKANISKEQKHFNSLRKMLDKEESKTDSDESHYDILKDFDISMPEFDEYVKRAEDKYKLAMKKLEDDERLDQEAEKVNEVSDTEEKDIFKPRNLVANLPSSQDRLDLISSKEELGDDDIDDEELESFYFSPEEIKKRETVWISKNKEYLIEQETKRLKQETDELAGNTSGKKKRRRQSKASAEEFADSGVSDAVKAIGENDTAANSATQIFSFKKELSKKINYESLDSLFS